MHIGTPAARLLLSGPEQLYNANKGLLEMLGTPAYVGELAGGASALDCAALASSMLSIIGLIYGIELCRSEGVDPESLVALANAGLAGRADFNRTILRAIKDRTYSDPPATIDTWGAVAHHVADIVAQNRLAPFPSDMLVEVFDRAGKAGLGSLDIAALAEFFRASDENPAFGK